MIEAEVHLSLHNFLRSQSGFPAWHHHLTMARLVARALRVGRSALIQVGALSGFQGRYRMSFIASALMWPGAVVVVASESVQQRLLKVEIKRLQPWLQTQKSIRVGDSFPHPDFSGLLLVTPQVWLQSQLTNDGAFPANIPTIIDGVDDLEDWVRQTLTQTLTRSDWDTLMLASPHHSEAIHTAYNQLSHIILRHPTNPYGCYLLADGEIEILQRLFSRLDIPSLPQTWQNFSQQFAMLSHDNPESPTLGWTTVDKPQGNYALHCAPGELAAILNPIWQRQPVVFIGSALEPETEAPLFRDRLGLGDVTCLKFASDNQTEAIQLYIPYQLPLPNTPEFQPALIHKIRTLVCLSATKSGLTVILVTDTPLKAQIGTILAAEFGSRVQVEKTCLDDNGILITDWEYWREHQNVLPAPQLLIITTLPLPSLEHPLVAGRVQHYKRQHQDWFRLYLLPTALTELQRAIAPVRESQGIVALLDSRVVNRSYGAQILNALSPSARINYLDPSLFTSTEEPS